MSRAFPRVGRRPSPPRRRARALRIDCEPAAAQQWLAEAYGFEIIRDRRRLGIVAEVCSDTGTGALEALLVWAGRLGRTLLWIPVQDVEAVVPLRKQIVLKQQPEAIDYPGSRSA